ncbi:putative phytosulfokines 6 [Punica granatum]|uniref:Phytosulfokine n=1 Tax=Punica granatum TaxID=22663 RepID=A0A6P8DQG2_PUNGR|nr:putative phytosulfokines 6 [Punica granatum]
MKQNHGIALMMLLLLILVVSHSSARLLKPNFSGEGGAMDESGIIAHHAAASYSDPSADFSNLMGTADEELEVCGEEDAECMKRRMTAEAHLDYIYTQHHKPKP